VYEVVRTDKEDSIDLEEHVKVYSTCTIEQDTIGHEIPNTCASYPTTSTKIFRCITTKRKGR
jgi:hypothetical protein